MDGSGSSWFKRWRWPLMTLAVVLSAEVVLRLGFGFCDAVLMQADPHYEYIAQPLQDRHRFGRHIVYNSLSMRSEEPDSAAILVLGCGDSVINGGSLTDNDSLATTILSRRLTGALGRKVQVLNIGAGSWGPDNCAAYLAKTALPRSRALLLVVSSHDAHDNMSYKQVVGVRKHFPAQQYGSALHELIDRYLLPKVMKPKTTTNEELGIDKGEEGFNTGFLALKGYAEGRGIPFIIYLHAERSEIKAGRYNAQGQEILAFAAQHGVRVIRDIDQGARVDELRDNIHPDEAGQRRMADVLQPVLFELVQAVPR